jgi:hypothetical protein
VTVGIVAFGILFAMCFSVCVGVRGYKQSLVKNVVGRDYHDNNGDNY